MIKRKKRAAVPVQDLSGVRLEPEFMIGNRRERFKSNASERCDNVGLDQLEDLSQIDRTVLYLGSSGPSIRVGCRTRTAHNGTCDEDIVAAQVDRIEERLEIVTRFVAEERTAFAIGSDATGSLADEHDFRIQAAVQIT